MNFGSVSIRVNGYFDSYQLQHTKIHTRTYTLYTRRIQATTMKNCNEITSEINMKLMAIRSIRLTHQFEFMGDSTYEFHSSCVSHQFESMKKKHPHRLVTFTHSLCVLHPADETNLSVVTISKIIKNYHPSMPRWFHSTLSNNKFNFSLIDLFGMQFFSSSSRVGYEKKRYFSHISCFLVCKCSFWCVTENGITKFKI